MDAPSWRPDYQPEGLEVFKLIPFFKLTLGSLLVNREEVLLLLNDKFTNMALEATTEAHEACKQAIDDIITHSLLLLDDNEPSSLITNERLLSHTLLEDIEQETKADP